mmetsp:Transcript_7042/g.29341  ORF Transcript_7042/g.29341 Transcript_7042/m.29341 type:complete len:345 (-) Transcript_7042:1830-2864(-)
MEDEKLGGVLGAAALEWLAGEARARRAKDAEHDACDGLSGLLEGDESDVDDDDLPAKASIEEEAVVAASPGSSLAPVFGVRGPLVWRAPTHEKTTPERSLEYHASHEATGHGDVLWASGERLAALILEGALDDALGLWRRRRRGGVVRVLEVGAGVGLPSAACAASGISVVATDAPCAASILALALTARRAGAPSKTPFAVRPLDWGDDGAFCDDDEAMGGVLARASFDVVLAADCIYNPLAHRALLGTIRTALRRPHGRAVVAYALHGNCRDADVLRFFDLAAEFGFNVDADRLGPAHQLRASASMRRHCCISDDAADRGHKRAVVHLVVLELRTGTSSEACR